MYIQKRSLILKNQQFFPLTQQYVPMKKRKKNRHKTAN